MNLKSILRVVLLAGLFLLPFIPLLVSFSLFFPFITTKVFTFRIIVEIVFISWLLLILLDRNYLPKKSWLLGSVILFLTVILIADIFGVDPYRSLWSNFERMEGFITLLHLGLFFIVAGSVLDNRLWHRFFNISLAVSVIVSIYSIFQLLGYLTINQGGVRVDGTLGNAIYLAVYLLFHIFIALFYFFRTKSLYRYIYLLIIALELFILYFTATRGAILGLIGGLFITFFLILLFERERKTLRRNAGIALLGIVLVIGGFIAVRDSQFVSGSPVLSRFAELSLDELKTQGRYFIWPIAIKGFQERPILGYGQENFLYVFNKHYDPALFNQEPWFDRVHNVFLDWLIAGGILGLLSYLTVLFLLFGTLWRSQNFSAVDKSLLSGLLAAYLFQGIFVFDNLTSYIMFFSVAAFVLALGSQAPRLALSLGGLNEKKALLWALPLVIVLLVASFYFINWKPLQANRNLILAIHPDTRLDVSLQRFEKVFSYDTFGNTEALIQLFGKTTNVAGVEAVPQELKEGYFRLTQRNIERQTAKFPRDARMTLIIGSFYSGLGLYKESLQYLERAKELTPARQDVYLGLGSVYFGMEEIEKAVENFEFAIELEPRNPEGAVRYAIAYLYSGSPEKAEPVLEEIDRSVYYSDDRLLNALVAAKQYERVLEIWQRRVEVDPRNTKSRQSITATYLKLGRWEEAIAEIEKIIEIDPSFKKTGEDAIGEIRAGRGSTLVD